MQFVVAVPQASSGKDYANLARKVCGVRLLVRTLATAQRAGADEVLLVWPQGMPLELAKAFLRSRELGKKDNVSIVAVESFDPDSRSSWAALRPYLEDQFIWLPWNWVTVARELSHLARTSSFGNWKTPIRISTISALSVAPVSSPIVGTMPSPAGVAVTSDETASAAEKFLVERSGKASDGIHSSFNRRLCRPAVRWLSHTRVTPNGVTLIGVLVSLFSAIAFARGNYWSSVVGALLFFLAGLFDEMDGMLARVKFADSPFGTYLESHADSLSYLFLFGGITIGLYRQYGNRELWVGGLLLIGAVLALVVTTLQRKRAAAADRPTEYLGNFYRKLEQDSSNWISYAVRHAQGFQRRGIMIHYVVLFTALGGLPVLFYLATLGAHMTWILALYYNRRFFTQPNDISLSRIHTPQEAS